MKWFLVAPDGLVVRSANADSIGEARFRLAPIPTGSFVVSAASHAAAPVPVPPEDKQASQARVLTAAHRQAIAQANTRRMYERRGWRVPTPEVVRRKNAAYFHRKRAENPNYLKERAEQRRKATIVKHDAIAAQAIGMVMEGRPDREAAAMLNVPAQVVTDIRHAYKVPDTMTLQREQRRVLLWYYRDTRGYTLQRASELIGADRKHLRTLDTSALREATYGV